MAPRGRRKPDFREGLLSSNPLTCILRFPSLTFLQQKLMKTLFPLLFLSACLLSAQEAKPEEETATPEKKVYQYQIDLDNLTAEKRKEYYTKLFKAQTLFNQKRIFETLAEINEVHKIYPNDPSSLNIKGACYVEFRNFDKARSAFQQALKAHPENPNVLFNLAEISFVTHRWEDAHDRLSALLQENANPTMSELIKFKILLCKIKLGAIEEAQAFTNETSFLDDSPLHYYANAAMAYSNDEAVAAEKWLGRASGVFRNAGKIAPWQDTLIEFGYIKSFYGGDLEVE